LPVVAKDKAKELTHQLELMGQLAPPQASGCPVLARPDLANGGWVLTITDGMIARARVDV
jgi:hypothetical protein